LRPHTEGREKEEGKKSRASVTAEGRSGCTMVGVRRKRKGKRSTLDIFIHQDHGIVECRKGAPRHHEKGERGGMYRSHSKKEIPVYVRGRKDPVESIFVKREEKGSGVDSRGRKEATAHQPLVFTRAKKGQSIITPGRERRAVFCGKEERGEKAKRSLKDCRAERGCTVLENQKRAYPLRDPR